MFLARNAELIKQNPKNTMTKLSRAIQDKNKNTTSNLYSLLNLCGRHVKRKDNNRGFFCLFTFHYNRNIIILEIYVNWNQCLINCLFLFKGGKFSYTVCVHLHSTNKEWLEGRCTQTTWNGSNTMFFQWIAPGNDPRELLREPSVLHGELPREWSQGEFPRNS